MLANEATATKPAGYYIKCDTCDALAKDDAGYTGAKVKYVGVVAFEDFEDAVVGEKKLPAGWTLVNGFGSYGIAEEDGNTYYYVKNDHINTPTGMKINLDLSDRGGHTKLVLSMKVKGGGDFLGVLQSSFMVYNADGVHINNNTSANSYSYNNNFSNISWEDWTQIAIEKSIVLPETISGTDVDPNGASATWQLVQRWNATDMLYVDDIIVDYVHTYELGLDSGVAAPGGTYIKCDHCDALKVNDANAEGDLIIPGEPSDPSEPSNPVEPSDPSEPSNPVEPSDPSEPSNPVEPSDPTEPSEPSEPSEPTEPAPSEPNEPVVPTGDYTALTLLMVVMALACVAMIATKIKFGYRK